MKEKNYAFIDSQNLNLGVRGLGWRLDFGKFRRYLKDKLRVTEAIIFIGYVPQYQRLYNYLKRTGYTIIFKPITRGPNGTVKGNVDAELVLHTMYHLCEKSFDKAVIVTGDGDFRCLVDHLVKVDRLAKLIVPNQYRYSSLLRQYRLHGHIDFLNLRRRQLENHKKMIGMIPQDTQSRGSLSS